MFETITTFVSAHPYTTTLMALLVLAMVISLKSETVITDTEHEEDMEDDSGEEMIVCTVP